MEEQFLRIIDAEENNLKNLTLEIPHNHLVAITGVSGSGKSTLAIDTIYAEGGRRYIETFSPYTRQFLDRLHQPKLSAMTGVRPALALEQRNSTTSSRSTVGTVSELNDYLKVIWAHLAYVQCPSCKKTVERDTPLAVSRKLKDVVEQKSPSVLYISFPLIKSGGATSGALAATLLSQGFLRYFDSHDQQIRRLDEDLSTFERCLGAEVLIVVDRIRIDGQTLPSSKERLLSSLSQAYTYGHGKLVALLEGRDSSFSALPFSEAFICNTCDRKFADPKPYMFSFNSPLGACPTCHGFGRVQSIDPMLCVPNPNLSINEGALACWSTDSTKRELKKLKSYCEEVGISLDTPWQKLPKTSTDRILFGSHGKGAYGGVHHWFEKLQKKRHKLHVRVFISRFRGEFLCDTCHGSRLQAEIEAYRVRDMSLPEFWKLPLSEALIAFRALKEEFHDDPSIEVATQEVISRLSYLVDIGLHYLTLDRQTRTLSGGEHQRVNLTSILGARLVNTLLVLDEPTIGLHATDTYRLIDAMRSLQERGNTVLVVEHDLDVISAVDSIIDIGPQSGKRGGEIVFQGPVENFASAERSLTAQYFSNQLKSPIKPTFLKSKKPKELVIRGARSNNLKNIDIRIPLERLVVLSGVSGSGKSSLLRDCLFAPYERLQQGVTLPQLLKFADANISGIEGLSHLQEIVLIDQTPIGKTPRSNPGTYTKAWEIIREMLAETPSAQQLGLSKSSFSFNVDGGRCPACKGAGQIRVEMQFLADVFVECEACGGARFQDKVLSVTIAGKNVLELLETPIEDVAKILVESGDAIRAKRAQDLLQPLVDLGLGYLRLGHPLSNTSGGEAQRIKIASYLSDNTNERRLFILDEPTTGLHPYNIDQLLAALRRLIEVGHSVLCVEHNLDVIEQSDWVIDLGPGGGENGGEIVAEGTPEQLQQLGANSSRSETSVILYERAHGKFIRHTEAKHKRDASTQAARNRPREIEVVGAKHHNLKNISVRIPHNKLTVVTGVSGSGKSTLAFDIIFAEGQRRFIDCLSPYARQYIKQLVRADVDRVSDLPPTIAISQKTTPPLGVSTVATTTELYQYLRLLYSKVGEQHCPVHDIPISSYSASSIATEISEHYGADRVFIFAPVVSGRKGSYTELFNRALRAEILEARIDKRMVRLHPELRLERHKLHWISLLVGSLKHPGKNPEILTEAIDHALLLGGGVIEVVRGEKDGEPEIFSTARVCPKCKRGYRELDPQDFSFRSARGVCTKCGGRGCIEKRGEQLPISCPDCHGSRIGAIGRHVYLGGKTIHQLTSMTAPDLLDFMRGLSLPKRISPVAEPILRELTNRLQVIVSVGLDYIVLDRDAVSISGGEAQRLRLAKTLGSPLTGVCYVLDEPSIGLHPSDQDQLMNTLFGLRDSGNTVVVVEHDEETIRQADYVVDIGPVGGAGGGRVVSAGSVQDIESCKQSITGTALRERTNSDHWTSIREGIAPSSKGHTIELRGAKTHNLKNLNVRIPLNTLTVVAGVSGAGKSSLVHGTLIPAVTEELLSGKSKKKSKEHRNWTELLSGERINRLVEIDQAPVGKTATSTPASFLGIFDEVRKIYAALPEARARGWSSSYFSFNTGKGRCSSCNGRGFIRVPMSFLPEATTVCEVCNGMRYSEGTLDLIYQGLSLGALLQKTMAEARPILANHRNIRRALECVDELGLGYITLGQPTHTLSGGEAQRLKIARELSGSEANDTLYVLDEPTVGLHMADVDRLVRVLRKLSDRGNTVVVIEHNLDVIRAADYLIELGPGPGESGGNLLFAGAPAELVRSRINTPTKPFLAPNRSELPERISATENSAVSRSV